MKTLVKIDKPSRLKELSLKGIEILQCTAGGGGTDFKSIVLRDTATNTEIDIRLGQYSDMNVFTQKVPEYETKFNLKGEVGPASICADFDKREEAEKWAADNNVSSPVIEEVRREKIDN